MMKKLHEQGYSLREIAGELELAGIPPKRGGEWQKYSIYKIISNCNRIPA